jgi:hypothetical protein
MEPISELVEIQKKRGFIIDMDGVIYHGNRLLEGVIRQNPGHVETVDFPQLNAGHFAVMILTILRLLSLIPSALRLRSDLTLENLALRQQLAILNRQLRRPKLRWSDRHFWLLLSRSWLSW